ncbi:hypothetical protein LX15_005978 [Streptoalloteichus tenebrarius]|uniref:XRE family transcriptional regulator n=1 Tax=Streptoalloteichus tenebrarius (strain ATCC 17920 / DSM 40477 / JCM 4838 / CBS 697.72 / NBRC 16177 / NCIMB 11028 / NRRL B-12390 / A12253. 1 / ISP 5477) TaxID=1933 RepID=A0ABT1I378_STRSD|nr:hypothetical protein [Streptoalloteichus tenebrarius]MCP2262244.1 hypothetical protein [Streptoalloteichus tenebrarius]BFF00776.1 hypothetical protein GCM10020241_24510 [Streptoalloteichus tenebrarius]
MTEDWAAVAAALNARTAELSMKQKELAERSGVSLAIIREMQQDRIRRRRNPRTLEALSIALGWHPQHLTAVLHGQEPPSAEGSPAPTPEDPVVVLLDTLVREVRGLRAQVGALANRLGPGRSDDARKHPKR